MILIMLVLITVALFAYTLGYHTGYDKGRGR